MKKILCFLLTIFILYLPINASSDSNNPYDSWFADEPQVQLDKEAVDDESGFGRIFIPAMSKPELEPDFSVYQDGKNIKFGCPVGKSCFLKPGKYTIILGSSEDNKQKIKKEITIEEGETKIIYPDWSGLIVKIIDQDRDFLRESYEIFDLPDYHPIGMAYSADEDEPGEYQDTWILKPGLYKIVRQGEPYNTYTNFTTIRLLPKELITTTIVVDNTSRNFVGSGIIPEIAELKKAQVWNVYTSLKGSFLLISNNEDNKDENVTTITLISKLENQIKLDKFPHYFTSRQILNLGLNKEHKQDFRISSNNIQIPTTYIYYFVKSFGVYVRFRIDTRPFPSKYYFDTRQDTIYTYDEDGNVIDILTDINEIQTAPMFFPMRFEEGLGLNISLLKSSRSNLSIKGGLGLSQTMNNDVFEQDSDNPKIFNCLKSVDLKGIEGSISGDFRIISNLSYFFEVYTLYPFDGERSQIFRLENTFNFRISRFVSLDYTLSLNRDESKDWVVQRHNLSVDITFISF
ncbi:MAG: DUF481 domain-containing protein [Candidatus Cloacimonetes bacterium]|nr:DUF481 domain-containing protein [Candidatus Cloacimonadota bacterium]